jgi:two-component system CheB/CheR fusion protein
MLEDILPDKKELEDFEVEQVFPIIGKRFMCLNARQIDNVNGEQLILLAIEDITDKRKIEQGLAEVERLLNESKERLKFAVDSAGLGTWDYDPQTKELIWDKRCKEIFGLLPTSSVDITSFFEKVHPEDLIRVEDSIKNTLSDPHCQEFDIEFRTIAIQQKIKWLKAKGRAYFNDQGISIRFIGTLLDITVQKLIDEATQELLSKKDEFISIASHELKTPVTSLKAILQIIERATLKKEEMKSLHAFVQKANKQVDKLTELIRDLLDVTKIQAGKLELKKTDFNLGELLNECREELQTSSAKHQIILEGNSNIKVKADRNRLEQVVINLISNAVKYSPDANKVIIKAEQTTDGVKIAVTDFGIGIPNENISLLFDRFYRVDEVSQRYAGLGLGLFISAEIIKQHRGHIYVESEVGKGSTFWFVIPN